MIDSTVQCVLPQNSVGRFVKRLVKDDGMGALLKGHNATQRCHFRALVARATDLTFRLAAYARRDADLTPHMVDAVRLCAIYICIYISIYMCGTLGLGHYGSRFLLDGAVRPSYFILVTLL